MSDAKVDGACLIARALAAQGVKYVFGIVGVPVIPIASYCQAEGIEYIGMRNEQAATYAANAIGYLTGSPGVALVVSGPGVVHALAGLANAWSNCWPTIVIGGANDSYQDGMGAFQESLQVEMARPYCKMSNRVDSIKRIPFWIEKAVKLSTYGRPGAVFLDFPADIISGTVVETSVKIPYLLPPPPKSIADPKSVHDALKLLYAAKNPLIIIGKGAAYCRAEHELLSFVEKTGIPFLPTPMGKGVISDAHPLCVAPARSMALKSADVVMLVGARLNWILHFGLPPRFMPTAKFIQIDISPEEMHTNVRTEYALVGDAQSIVNQMNSTLTDPIFHNPGRFGPLNAWKKMLKEKIDSNVASTTKLEQSTTIPMSYYAALAAVRESIPQDAIICSEGSNTMDIYRSISTQTLPRHRLDAGTYGTMGVGLGFAVAAQVANRDKRVVAIEGDSAFGFSGMEVETMVRYNLPIVIIVINNNGIYTGVSELSADYVPPTALSPTARYEDVAVAFGGKGYRATTPAEVRSCVAAALKSNAPSVVNVLIDPEGSRRPQEFPWLTQETPSKL